MQLAKSAIQRLFVREQSDTLMKKIVNNINLRKVLTGLIGGCLVMAASVPAFADPSYPDGRKGVNLDGYYAYKLVVPAGRAVQFQYGYSAEKENHVMIYEVRQDRNLQVIGNDPGNGQYLTNVFSDPIDVEYIITGYSKDCRRGHHCSRRDWAQEPILVDLQNQTVRFDDSCDPGPGTQCTFTNSWVSWRFIN